MNKLKKLFIIAYKNIFRKKKRGIMVGSTILISVVLLLVTNALASGIDKSIYKQQIYIDSGHILVKWDKDNDTSATDSKKKEIHDKLVTVIGDNKHVKNVFYNYVDTVHAHFSSSKIINCTLVAADYNAEKHLLKNAIKLVEGKFPEEGKIPYCSAKNMPNKICLKLGLA
jgi:ABC-type lipoprotein release transport system permease subunit